MIYQDDLLDIVTLFIYCAKTVSHVSRELIEIVLHIESERCILENEAPIINELLDPFFKISQTYPEGIPKSTSSLTLLIAQAGCYNKLYLGSKSKKIKIFSGMIEFVSTTYLHPHLKFENKFDIDLELEGIYYPLLIYYIDPKIAIPILEFKYHIYGGPYIIASIMYDIHRSDIAKLTLSSKKENSICYYLDIANTISQIVPDFNFNTLMLSCPVKFNTIMFIGAERQDFELSDEETDNDDDTGELSIQTYLFFVISFIIILFLVKCFGRKKNNNGIKFIQLQNFEDQEKKSKRKFRNNFDHEDLEDDDDEEEEKLKLPTKRFEFEAPYED